MQQNPGSVFLTCVLLMFSGLLSAQVNSPYSRYGPGNVFPQTFESCNGMGGLSAANFTPTNINFVNPASYPSLLYTTFEVGAYGEALSLTTFNDQYSAGDGNLSYLALGFPVLRHLRHSRFGLSFGLVPYSGFQYNIEQDIENGDTLLGTIANNYIGSGILYQFYGGLGYQYRDTSTIIKYRKPLISGADTTLRMNDTLTVTQLFNVGANTAYMFGTLENKTVASFPDQINAQETELLRDNKVRGLTWNTGIAYQNERMKRMQNIFELRVQSFGATFNPDLPVNGTQSVAWYNVEEVSGVISITDTLYLAPDTSGSLRLPASFKIGYAYSFFTTDSRNKNQFTIGAEFGMTQWSHYRGIQSAGELADNWTAAVGLELIPKGTKPVIFRTGFRYGTSNLEIGGKQLKQGEVTFGAGLPIGGGKNLSSLQRTQGNSKINLSLSIGQRGSIDFIRERYVRFGVGFTLNDSQWFGRYRLN